MSLIRKKFDYIGTPVLAGIFVALFILERKFQLRKRVQNRSSRTKVNVQVALPSFMLLRFMFMPAVIYLANRNNRIRFLISTFLPTEPLRQVAAFLFLDYTNYLWHRINHKIRFLWRFHAVHHSDKDLDLTTAFRFHFGEMIGSVFFRGACTFFSGATPLTVVVYEIAFEAATQFHHSNTRLPMWLDRFLNKLIVVPAMHGIHHSINRQETDTNFSVIFSIWDRLHKTLYLDVAQESLVIGLPSLQEVEGLTAGRLMKLPFLTNIEL
jgi:sterol desaturase/sphingolipid hydroxylase (fatty acid hydroxylase superfamily)